MFDVVMSLNPKVDKTDVIWSKIYNTNSLVDVYSASWIYQSKDKIKAFFECFDDLCADLDVSYGGECCASELYVNCHCQVCSFDDVEKAKQILLKYNIKLS